MTAGKKVDEVDWSLREKKWDDKKGPGHLCGGKLFGHAEKLPTVRPPLKRQGLFESQSGTSSIRMLKKIIEKAEEVKHMTVKARMELEASNLVMNTFIDSFGIDDDDISSIADSVPESLRDGDALTIDNAPRVGSLEVMNGDAIIESYEKQTLLRYEQPREKALEVNVLQGRHHSAIEKKRMEEKKDRMIKRKELTGKAKKDVAKHARFLPVVKE